MENNDKIKKTEKPRIFITGGAGYIGSMLVPMLIEQGYEVTIYDLFNFGCESLLSCTFSANLKLIKGDIRDEPLLKESMKNADVIIHLAGIVGYPACSKDPELARTVNVDGTANVVRNMSANQKIVFSSTGSCYGAIPDGYCTEETPLSPLSLYGSTKADGEKLVHSVNGVILRLATIFGVAQRLRLDLLINDLVHKALTQKKFDIYESHFRRTFLHVRDVARAFIFAVENYELMKGQVYNVGGDELNYTKLQICEFIQEMVDGCEIVPSNEGTDADKRDYKVSYDKIRKLGFKPTIGVREGIDELKKVLPNLSAEFLHKTRNV